MTDAVPGFTLTSFAHEGRERDVYWAGTGPAVIVIHELPGLHRGVTAFGQRVVDAGFTVYLPSLFGRPGEPYGGRELLRSMSRVCVSREFFLLTDRTSPVATWLRALAAVNPLAYAVNAARAVFNNQVGDPSVAKGIAIMAVLAVLAVLAGVRSFGRAVA